jgi:HEAT repeat protein
MSKAAFEAKLAAIDALKSAEAGPARDAALRKALADRNNYVAAKAARTAGETLSRSLIPELLAAFDRFMSNPVKSDPQCWAKIAIVKALAALGNQEPEAYFKGIRHVQMEPVWGGRQDTAGPLRSACAEAIIDCRAITDVDALEVLIEILHDPDKTVRAEAACAIGRIDRREAALILLLRALAGDAEPEPMGAVFAGVLAIEGKRGIPFVARFLDGEGDAPQEAALALAETHDPDTLPLLRAALDRAGEPAIRATFAMAIALTRLPEAIDFLIGLARDGSQEAERALRAIPLSDDQRTLLDEAMAGRG